MSEKKEDKAPVAKPALTPSKSDKKAEKVIYLGPPMIEGSFQINYGAIYSNGLPQNIKEKADADSDFAKLFVPVGEAAKSMRELTRQGSDLSAAKSKVSREYLERKRKRKEGGE